MKYFLLCLLIALTASGIKVNAQDDGFEVETTRIQSNQELPQVLYVVPWKDVTGTNQTQQKLTLHDFFGDLYEPLIPSKVAIETNKLHKEKVESKSE